MIITYDHNGQYSIDGKKVPRVTTILKILEPFDGFPTEAATRGTYVHEICELHDQDDLDPASVHPDLAGYLAAWEKFKAVNPLGINFDELATEVKLGSKLGYAGRVDRISDSWILDIKTGEPTKTHHHQLIAYKRAADETIGKKPRKMADIYISKTGDYRVVVQRDDAAAWNQFLAALTVLNFRGGKI